METGIYENSFSINEKLPFSVGENTVIAFTSDAAIVVDLEQGQSSTYILDTSSFYSVLERKGNIIISATDDTGYYIGSRQIDADNLIKLKKTSGKVKLIDMEYSAYKPLPYHSCIGY